jgi:hypothetical protein
MSTAKGIGFLLLFYLLVGGLAIWRVREVCLLQHDTCDYYNFLDTIFSNRLVAVACALFIGLMVFVTASVFARLRDNTLGIDLEEPPRRRLNVNGHIVVIIVFAIYLIGSWVVMTSAASDLASHDEGRVESFFWKAIWAMNGALILPMVMWHLNDYFVKPASKILLALLSFVTLGTVFWIARSALLAV